MFTIHFDKPFKKCVYFCINIMHHLAFHSFKSESHKFFFSKEGQPVSKVVRLSSSKVNSHLQHSCKRLNKKSTNICEEVTTLQVVLERLSTLVASLVAS